MRNPPKARGFTLVELLVTIAVIAILVSLLLPAIAMAKESARTVVCMNNCRQIGTATALYAEDSRGRIPSFYNWLFSTREAGSMAIGDIKTGRIYPYLTTKDVYMCPTDRAEMRKPRPYAPRIDRANGYGGHGWRQQSYGMSCMECHYNDLSYWKTPSKSAIYVEAAFSTNDCSGIIVGSGAISMMGGPGAFAFRHRGKSFTVRADFSVQPQLLSKTQFSDQLELLVPGPSLPDNAATHIWV